MQEHHYLPQFYQRRWAAAKDGPVFVYQRPHDRVVVAPKSTKATGKRVGLYTVSGAPAKRANDLEDNFWRVIDQWGSDSLSVLESTDPAHAAKLVRERWAIFVMSLFWRNPQQVTRINTAAKARYTDSFSDFASNYGAMRRPHEPDNYEEFMALFEQPGISEFGAKILRAFTLNDAIRKHVLTMDWQVVTLSNSPVPLLTSDNPMIRYKGLKDPDGLLMLPLGPNEFFAAFNRGEIDMQKWIDQSISHGCFIEAMNKYVVQHAIKYVYGVDDTQLAFVERFLPSEPLPVEPLSIPARRA
jgi:hypothetical protein